MQKIRGLQKEMICKWKWLTWRNVENNQQRIVLQRSKKNLKKH